MRCLVLATLSLVFGSISFAQGLLFEEQHRMTPSESVNDLAVAAGDLDGDGNVDLLVCPEEAVPHVRLGDGIGTFRQEPNAVPEEVFPADGVELADVDGDGDLDAFLGRPLAANGLLVNGGSGIFSDESANLPGLTEWTRASEFADVDGDGDPDLLLAHWLAEPDGLRLNDGTGVFTDASGNLPALPLWTNDLAAGDVDADGDLDYVTVNGYLTFNRKGRLFLNDGAGVFTESSSEFASTPAVRFSVDLGDVDDDGDLDYVASSALAIAQQEGPIEVLWNDGAGVFALPPQGQPLMEEVVTQLELHDIDGDGDEDMVATFVALSGGVAARWYEAKNGTFAEVPTAFPTSFVDFNDLVVADVDGDQDPDLFFASQGQDRLFLNDGEGAFVEDASRLPEFVREGRDVAADDLDGDGFADLLFADSLTIFRGDGTGSFTEAGVVTSPVPSGERRLGVGDLEGDGDADLVFASSETNSLYLNSGSGAFSNASDQLPPNASRCRAVELGDLDGDGDLDAVFVQDQPAGDYLQRNDGAGVFGQPVHLDLDTIQDTHRLALSDLNGDGVLDIVIVGAATTHLLVGDGLGGYEEDTSTFPGIAQHVEFVALGDVDGDGDPDALFDRPGAPAQLYENDGDAVFVEVTQMQLPEVEYRTGALELGDLDLDGDLDVFLGVADGAGDPDSKNTVLLNDGAGSFTDAPELLPDIFESTRAIALSDFDLDGDLDVVVANLSYQSRVLTNRVRALTRRGTPRVNKLQALELSGPPGTVWFLAVAPEDFLLPLPPYGLLRLDPFLAVPLGLGVLDAEGRAGLEIHVPDDPTLVGVDYFWQAVVGAPLRLTNLERTTFTAF